MAMFAANQYKADQKGYAPLRIAPASAPINVAGDMPSLPQMAPQVHQSFLGKAAPFLGIIGDALLAANGRPAMYTPLMQARQEREAERQNALDDWRAKFDYELAHPKPVNNDTANDYAFWQQHLTPDQFEQYKQKQFDPVVSIPLPNGQMYMGPRSGMASAMGGSSVPTVTDQQSYNAVPAGGQYRDPSGHLRTKGGGASNGTGGFLP